MKCRQFDVTHTSFISNYGTKLGFTLLYVSTTYRSHNQRAIVQSSFKMFPEFAVTIYRNSLV